MILEICIIHFFTSLTLLPVLFPEDLWKGFQLIDFRGVRFKLDLAHLIVHDSVVAIFTNVLEDQVEGLGNLQWALRVRNI